MKIILILILLFACVFSLWLIYHYADQYMKLREFRKTLSAGGHCKVFIVDLGMKEVVVRRVMQDSVTVHLLDRTRAITVMLNEVYPIDEYNKW